MNSNADLSLFTSKIIPYSAKSDIFIGVALVVSQDPHNFW